MYSHDDLGKQLAKVLVQYKIPITADFISALTILLPIAAFFYFWEYPIFAAILWYMGRALDYVDGNYARASNTVTEHGKYFDCIIGVVSWVLLYVSIPVQFPIVVISLGIILIIYSKSLKLSTLPSTKKERWIDTTDGCLPAWLIIPAAIFEILDWYIYISIIGNFLYCVMKQN